jgi:hypothetical protein
MTERKHVKRVLDMLVDEPGKRKRIYVLIGNEPVDDCMRRIHEVIRWGGEPYAQAYIKLNAIEKKPHVRFDWTPQLLIDVPRWVNRHLWRGLDFATYRRGKKGAPEIYDGQQGLFV